MNNFIELYELIGFFEVEPIIDESDVPWQFSGVAFETIRENNKVYCSLAPGEGCLTFIWWQNNIQIICLSLKGYEKLNIENTGGVEKLVAIPNDGEREPFELQLKPYISVIAGFE